MSFTHLVIRHQHDFISVHVEVLTKAQLDLPKSAARLDMEEDRLVLPLQSDIHRHGAALLEIWSLTVSQ